MKLSEVGGGTTRKLSQVPDTPTPREPARDYTNFGTGDIDPNLSGGDVKAMAKGAVAGTLGAVGDIEKAIFPSEPNLFPSSEGVSRFFRFGDPADDRERLYRDLGGVAGGAAAPGSAGKAASSAIRTAGRIMPGATKRAQSLVHRIAEPTNPNAIGEAIRDKLAPRFENFESTRQGEFQKWLASQGKKDVSQARIDDPAFDAAFRKTYRELSEDVNQFGDTLGKHATGEARDPISLPAKAFRSKASVESLKRLSGGDDAFVNGTAREWVATELRRVTEPAVHAKKPEDAASAARKWYQTAHDNWLQYLPEIDKEVASFVDNFEAVATTQSRAAKTAKIGGGGLAAGLGISGGNALMHRLGF